MKWKKPSGFVIETNDKQVTQDYMKSLGCELVEGPAVPQDDPPPADDQPEQTPDEVNDPPPEPEAA